MTLRDKLLTVADKLKQFVVHHPRDLDRLQDYQRELRAIAEQMPKDRK